MDKVIILSDLARSIAGLTQCSADDAETFVRELFRLAAERLESDRRVEIPGIGTFVVTDETVAYAPDAGLAHEINAPFASFEPVELPADYTDNVPGEADNTDTPAPETDASSIAEAAEFEEKEDACPEEEEQPATTPPEPEPEPRRPEPEQLTNPVPAPEITNNARAKSNNLVWFAWAASCIVCLAIGWFARDLQPKPLQANLEAPVPAEEPAEASADSISSISPINLISSTETAPTEAAKPVTDTIRPGKFLTTMARNHYGRMEFWVYIYEANASVLGHPDRLSAGTVVVIPPARSLGLDPEDPSQIEIAKRKAAEIYARFN